MLTKEEEEHKEEIVQLTEDVLQAKGIQCDASISKIPEEELKEILEKVRELRKKKKTVTYTRAGDKMDTTTCWLSMLGIGTLCCGISLFGNNSDTNYYCLFHNWHTASCTMVVC